MSIRIKFVQALIDINEKLIFYPKLKKFYAKKINTGVPIILDVGSNKGQSIDFFLSLNKACKIYGFEPNAKLFRKLKEKYKHNSNIKLNNQGISSFIGMLTFHENIMNETSTFENINYNSDYLKKKANVLGVAAENIVLDSYEVKVTTLHDYIKVNKFENIDILKIDVEGHELKCLQGLFSNSAINCEIKYIQLEKHNDDMYLSNSGWNEILNLLTENSYIENGVIKHGFGDFHEVIYKKC